MSNEYDEMPSGADATAGDAERARVPAASASHDEELTNEIALAIIRKGLRVGGKHSLHERQNKDACPNGVHGHWRVLYCNNEEDVIECARCGKQRIASCNFDEDMA